MLPGLQMANYIQFSEVKYRPFDIWYEGHLGSYVDHQHIYALFGTIIVHMTSDRVIYPDILLKEVR